MKKIMIALFFLVSSFCFTNVNAQTTKKKTAKTTITKTKDSSTVKKASLLKKDGTKDMRFKANKTSATTTTPAGPTKKDGTADMRYKANKDKAKSK